MSQRDEKNNDSSLHGTRLTAHAVYKAIQRDGEDELERHVMSLWWSGVAAGFVMAVCLLAKGFIHSKLPAGSWVSLLDNFGYALGFIIVVLGRMQLFTETTITAVLPIFSRFSVRLAGLGLRLWGVVFLANLVGTLCASLFIYYALATPAQLDSMIELSVTAMQRSGLEIFLAAIPAGFLVAAIVWMLPNGRGNEFWLILFVSYLIGLGSFPHVIVGSVEAFLLFWHGQMALTGVLFHFLLPALFGNIIGGTLLFSVLAYGQVRDR